MLSIFMNLYVLSSNVLFPSRNSLTPCENSVNNSQSNIGGSTKKTKLEQTEPVDFSSNQGLAFGSTTESVDESLARYRSNGEGGDL